MTTPPKVSVIMATYNCHDTVRQSIESIINQTLQDWEFIICDDCSTDDTYSILKKYETLYPDKFIILKNDKNSKLSFSLNRCLAVAKGKYIARMDGDDISLPNRIEEQVNFLEANKEYAVVGCAMTPFDEQHEYQPRIATEIPNDRSLIWGVPFAHATILMRKSAYDKIGGYTVSKRTARGQDYDLWFKFFSCGFKGYNLQKSYYKVREDRAAYKRRTFRTYFYTSLTMLKGFKLLKFPLCTYIYAFKPIISALVPIAIMKKLHSKEN